MVTSVGSVWVGMRKEKRTSGCLSLVDRRVLYSFWFRSLLPVKGKDRPYSDTSSSKRPEDTSPYRRRLPTGPIPVPRCQKTSTTLPEIPDIPTTPSISLPVISSYAESPPAILLNLCTVLPFVIRPDSAPHRSTFLRRSTPFAVYPKKIFRSPPSFMAGPVPWRSPSKRPKEGPLWPSGRLGHAYHLPIASTFDNPRPSTTLTSIIQETYE